MTGRVNSRQSGFFTWLSRKSRVTTVIELISSLSKIKLAIPGKLCRKPCCLPVGFDLLVAVCLLQFAVDLVQPVGVDQFDFFQVSGGNHLAVKSGFHKRTDQKI